MDLKIKACAHCGQDLVFKRPSAIYCSRACKDSAHHKRPGPYRERQYRRQAKRLREKRALQRSMNGCLVCGCSLADRSGQAKFCSVFCRESCRRQNRPPAQPRLRLSEEERRERAAEAAREYYHKRKNDPGFLERKNELQRIRLGDPKRRNKEQERHRRRKQQEKKEREIVQVIKALGWLDDDPGIKTALWFWDDYPHLHRYTRQCNCGRYFATYRASQWACSNACRSKNTHQKVHERVVQKRIAEKRMPGERLPRFTDQYGILRCPNCQGEVKANHGNRVFCSQQCRRRYHYNNRSPLNPEPKYCARCMNEFVAIGKRRRFCCEGCRMATNNSGRQGRDWNRERDNRLRQERSAAERGVVQTLREIGWLRGGDIIKPIDERT